MNAHSAEPPLGGTIDHILSLLPSLLPSAQRVARICVERPQEVAGMSGADLADAAETSAATVSRTSRALGFRGFQHLRLLLVRDLGASAREHGALPAGTAGRLHAIAEGAADAIRTCLASVDPEAFDAAVEAVAAASRVLVVGTGASGPIAQSAAIALSMSGRPCEAPVDGVVQPLVARLLEPGDVCVAVSASGANAATIAAAAAAAEAGATVVAVTGFARSPLAERAHMRLVAGARIEAWDGGLAAGGLAQQLLLSALQLAVSERMGEVAERARAAVRDEVLGLMAGEGEAPDDEAVEGARPGGNGGGAPGAPGTPSVGRSRAGV